MRATARADILPPGGDGGHQDVATVAQLGGRPDRPRTDVEHRRIVGHCGEHLDAARLDQLVEGLLDLPLEVVHDVWVIRHAEPPRRRAGAKVTRA
jgi:hypothetical protein